MKKIKIAFLVIILIFIVLFVCQNEVFFIAKNRLGLKFPFLETLHIPELPNIFFFLTIFLIGFLIAYLFSLSKRFKYRQTIRNLNTTTTSRLEEVSALKKELESLQTEQFVKTQNEKEDIMEEQSQQPTSEKAESFFNRIKRGGRAIAEKSAKAKDSMAGKFGKIDAENCTLQEAMTKIEEDVFAGTKILEDLEARFMGSARKLRDQIARKTAKTIYDRWENDQEKEELKPVIELDYDDV
jgi:uncharacterized integral membrane protein